MSISKTLSQGMQFGPDLTIEFKNMQKLYKLHARKRDVSNPKEYLQEGSPEEQ